MAALVAKRPLFQRVAARFIFLCIAASLAIVSAQNFCGTPNGFKPPPPTPLRRSLHRNAQTRTDDGQTDGASGAAAGAAAAAAAVALAPHIVVIILSGVQGTGKSTLCRLLGKLYAGSIWINQDNTGSGDVRTRRKRFFTALRQSMQEAVKPGTAPRLVLLDRMNISRQSRKELADFLHGHEAEAKVLLAQLTAPGGKQGLKSVANRRVLARGKAHPTMGDLSRTTVKKIIHGTVNQVQALSTSEHSLFDSRLLLDTRSTPVMHAIMVMNQLDHLGWPRAREWAQPEQQRVDICKLDLRELPIGATVFSGGDTPLLPSGGGGIAELRAFLEAELDILTEAEELACGTPLVPPPRSGKIQDPPRKKPPPREKTQAPPWLVANG